MQANKFTRVVLRFRDGVEVEYLSVEWPSSRGVAYWHQVTYHPNATVDGLDGLDINGMWFEDRHADDMFCSEMFQALTGLYPYEFRELVPATRSGA